MKYKETVEYLKELETRFYNHGIEIPFDCIKGKNDSATVAYVEFEHGRKGSGMLWQLDVLIENTKYLIPGEQLEYFLHELKYLKHLAFNDLK